MISRCPDCGQSIGTKTGPGRSAHCHGGAFGGCCRTFTSDVAFTHHRTGPHHPDGQRVCVDVTTTPGWRSTSRGWTDSAPMPVYVLASRAGWSA